MNFNPYTILGLSKKATDKDIKAAYKEKSLQCHPDINKDTTDDTFSNCTQAKNLLLDHERRQAYDRGGWDLVKRLDEMKREREHRSLSKCEHFVIKKQVTLKQIYNKEKVKLEATIPQYDDKGKANSIDFKFDLDVHQGMVANTVVLQNQGINRPDCLPGDILVSFELIPDPSLSDFKIKGNHLIAEVPLSLGDILYGYHVSLKHPDGNTYSISGTYTEDDNVKVFQGMGFPVSDDDGEEAGDLLVKPLLDLKKLVDLPDKAKKALIATHPWLHQTKNITGSVDITDKGKTIEEIQRLEQQKMHRMMMGGRPVMMGSMEGGSQQCGVQ